MLYYGLHFNNFEFYYNTRYPQREDPLARILSMGQCFGLLPIICIYHGAQLLRARRGKVSDLSG